MLKHIDDVQIPDYLLPALINGDTTGLSDTEENDLELFLSNYANYDGLVFVDKGEPYFAWSNPVNGLGCTVIDVSLYGKPIENVDRKQALLTYWLYVFNEQMHDADLDWIELEPEQAHTSALFLHWLDVWSDDSRGALLDMLTSKGANHA